MSRASSTVDALVSQRHPPSRTQIWTRTLSVSKRFVKPSPLLPPKYTLTPTTIPGISPTTTSSFFDVYATFDEDKSTQGWPSSTGQIAHLSHVYGRTAAREACAALVVDILEGEQERRTRVLLEGEGVMIAWTWIWEMSRGISGAFGRDDMASIEYARGQSYGDDEHDRVDLAGDADESNLRRGMPRRTADRVAQLLPRCLLKQEPWSHSRAPRDKRRFWCLLKSVTADRQCLVHAKLEILTYFHWLIAVMGAVRAYPSEGTSVAGGAGRYGVPAGPELFWLLPQLRRTRELPIGVSLHLVDGHLRSVSLHELDESRKPLPGGILTYVISPKPWKKDRSSSSVT
ncbi:hypothetical protein MRB53_038094 [Persea americana]|nr:hypothetical protein MRB53_038094 [Persea americana]